MEARAARNGESVADARRGLIGEKQPSGEAVRPEDLAELAAFLASDPARQITGAEVSIDGGWTAI